MPIVPSYDNFQVQQNVLSPTQIAAPNIDNLAAKQAQQFGEATQQLGKNMLGIMQNIQQQAN